MPQSDLFDSSYLSKAITAVALEVKKQEKKNYLFVVNSTTTPGTCTLLKDLVETLVGDDLNPMICYKPEFIALGEVVQGITHPDVVLIGEGSPEAGDALEEIYRRVAPEATFHRMSLVEAELAKISLNCYITMKISFANQLAMAAEKYGADAKKILASIGDDKRVGSRCLNPGLPFGGPCFPRDNRMFRAVAKFAPLAEATDRINFEVRERIADQVRKHFSPYSSSPTVGILGMAYKPGTSLTDDSLGSWLQATLARKGYIVRTHDPLAEHTNMLDEVLSCQLLIVACAHKEYAELRIPNYKTIIDPAGILKQKVGSELASA
jgi:UDPglucose 6-dehydrogenase